MQIGIVGLPFSGKSTLFQAATKTRIDPALLSRAEARHAVVKVPDPRLNKLSALFSPKSTVPAAIEFIDVVGLKKGESGSAQFTTNFFSNVKTNDALVQVVRAFENDAVPRSEGDGEIMTDIRTFETEFIIADMAMAATPFAETSTTPVGRGAQGNLQIPLDYVHLAIAAGAEYVAQVSPAHGKLFVKSVERALASQGTAVLFVPAPCISGWKFDDGRTVEIAMMGARTGVFPAFVWERGKGGQVKDCDRDPAARPALEEFLGAQRRFHHLVERDKESGTFRARPEREAEMARLREWTQQNVERLYGLAELK